MKNRLLIILALFGASVASSTYGAAVEAASAKEEKTRLGKELVEKAMEGDLAGVKLLVSKGADVNFSLERTIFDRHHPTKRPKKLEPITPLVAAIKAQSYDIVQFLIEQGADVNQKTSPYGTPLNHALSSEPALMGLLLRNGAKPDEESVATVIQVGSSGLLIAQTWIDTYKIKVSQDESNKMLSEALRSMDYLRGLNRAEQEITVRHIADVTKFLIKNGADITLYKPPLYYHETNAYPLLFFAAVGDEDMVRLLLEKLQQEAHKKALAALLAGKEILPEAEQLEEGLSVPPDVVLTVLKPIIDSIINQKGDDGHTALWHARHGEHPNKAIEKMLVDAGAREE